MGNYQTVLETFQDQHWCLGTLYQAPGFLPVAYQYQRRVVAFSSYCSKPTILSVLAQRTLIPVRVDFILFVPNLHPTWLHLMPFSAHIVRIGSFICMDRHHLFSPAPLR